MRTLVVCCGEFHAAKVKQALHGLIEADYRCWLQELGGIGAYERIIVFKPHKHQVSVHRPEVYQLWLDEDLRLKLHPQGELFIV